MDPITSQPPEPLLPPQHKHFLNKKFLITLVVLLLLGGGAYAGIWYWGNQQVSLVQPDSLAATYYPSYSNYPAFVQLTWDYPVADYFNIYRSVDQKNWQKISSNFPQSAHAAIDRELPTGVGTLYYQITSSDGRGNESEPSQIASVSLTSSVDISTWKTYTNGQYGFSFQYPSAASVTLGDHVPPHGADLLLPCDGAKVTYTDANSSVCEFTSEKDGTVGSAMYFFIFPKPMANLESYVRESVVGNPVLYPAGGYTKININGQEAYEVKYANGYMGVYVQNSKNLFMFQYAPENIETAKMIVFTFKFTDSVQGMHCGGNIQSAPTCPTGYTCKLNVSMPDTGGTCQKN